MDIKTDIPNCQIHKYANTNSQIYKYTNTAYDKVPNICPTYAIFLNSWWFVDVKNKPGGTMLKSDFKMFRNI